MNFKPLHSTFAAEVSGVELNGLRDHGALAEIRAGMAQYAVLVFRNQRFEGLGQLDFAERLDGQLHRKTGASALGANRFGDEALTDISNVDNKGEVMPADNRSRLYSLGNRLWHTDASFQNPAGRFSLLSAKVLPPVAADTQFADTRAAYDQLDEQTKASLEGLTVHHSIAYSRQTLGFEFSEEEAAKLPGAIHPLVRKFRSGRRALYVASHAAKVFEMSLPEGRLLLRDCLERATHPDLVFSHRWQPDDLVIWDNRATMHRSTEFDDQRYRRELVRVTTLDIDEPGAHAKAA